jgi:hypothetical protein
MSLVRQVCNLRPIFNRPGAGPLKSLRRFHQPRLHGVHFDIRRDSLQLGSVPYQSVVTFNLPKRLACPAHDPVRFSRCEPLERLGQPGNLYPWSDQEMNVVGHDDVRMELVVFQTVLSVSDRVHYHVRDQRLSKIQRAVACSVQKAIHRHKGLSGGRCCGETATRRNAAVQAPSEEHWLADRVKMWQTTDAEDAHKLGVGNRVGNSLFTYQADCQSAAGFQPALHTEGKR